MCDWNKDSSGNKKYGIKVDLIPEEFNAEGLIEAISENSKFKIKKSKFKRDKDFTAEG